MLAAACGGSTPQPVTSVTTTSRAAETTHGTPVPAVPGAYLDLGLAGVPVETRQRAKLDAIRATLVTRTEPVRVAQRQLLALLANGVDAGRIDTAAADASMKRLVDSAQQTAPAVIEAVNDLHAALTPEQRSRTRGAFFMRWQAGVEERAREGNAVRAPGTGPASRLPMLTEGLVLTTEQLDAVRARLQSVRREPGLPSREDHARHRALMNAFRSAKFDAGSFGVADDFVRSAQLPVEQATQVTMALLPQLNPAQRGLFSQALREPDRWMH